MARTLASRRSESAVPSADRRPNILLLCADDHRADAIGGLGHPVLRTPNWDRLLRDGSAFTNTYTTVPICTPARGELLTGCDAFTNGVRWFGETLKPDLTLLPQAFAEAGYRTFFTGKWHNDGHPSERGYTETRRVFCGGMTEHRMRFAENGKTIMGFSSELFAEAVNQFLEAQEDSETPWFAHVAFTAPHDPRTPPMGWRVDPRRIPLPPNFMPEHPFDNGEMTIRDEQLAGFPRTEDEIRQHLADYYGMLLHLDAQIGRILAELDAVHQRHQTIVVYTSDHGLAVGSHGLMGKMSMYDHSVRVPLLLRGPGIPEGERFDTLCMGYDLYPTLCDLCEIPVPQSVQQGKSLKPVLDAPPETHRDAVFCAYQDVQRMVRTDRYKYIVYPKIGKEQLFDLQTDPDELTNLLDEWRFRPTPWYKPQEDGAKYQEIAATLRTRLQDWQKSVGDTTIIAE
ncbi:MAG: sulfatase-like hydrolase/transferase [Armatimonadaceae bacterium]